MWHMRHDMWHMTHDIWNTGGGENWLQILGLALTVWDLWHFEDWEGKDDSINELIKKVF